MSLKQLALPAALSLTLLAPALVLAHAELLSTSPSDGENLDDAPDEVVMTFDSELDPDGSEFTVTDASDAVVGRGEVDLQVADRNEMRGEIEITRAGIYTVSWTILAADGDETSASFSFGYRAEPGASPEEAPNSATSAGGDPRLLLAGAAALTIGCLRGARSLRPWRRQCP